MQEEIKMTDRIYGDFIRILVFREDEDGCEIGGEIITKIICEEYGDSITFADVLEIAREAGFRGGEFMVIAETPLRGIIYKYADCYECEPYWCEYGTTRGYA